MPRLARTPSNSVKDRPGRLKLLLRRQRRFLWPACWAALGLVAVLLVVWVVRPSGPGGTVVTLRERLGHATAFAGLRVKEVVIEGRANTPEPLLRAAIGVAKGDPILGFSVADARARVETLSWVQHATVERRLPGTIVVNLVERRPFAIWQNQGKFVLIDRDGQVVADEDVAQFSHLPLVVGPGAPAGTAVLLDALARHPSLQARVVASVRIGERRWNLRLQSGTDVLLPEGAEPAAIERLESLEQAHALLDRPLQVVDMRLPDRLVVRPLSDPHAAEAASPPGLPRPPPAPAKKPT
jgi:cell division protein FtsQ